LFQQIVPETSDEEKEEGDEPDISPVLGLHSTANIAVNDVQLPKMNNVPKMTEDDKEEVEERDEELADVTEREEKEEDGEEDE